MKIVTGMVYLSDETYPWGAFDALLEEIERRGKCLFGQIAYRVENRGDDTVIIFRDSWSGRYVGQVLYPANRVGLVVDDGGTLEGVRIDGDFDFVLVGGYDRLTLRAVLKG